MTKLYRGAVASFATAFVVLLIASSAAQISVRFSFVVILTFAMVVGVALIGLAGHPYDRFGLANRITTLRAGLMALAAGFIGERAFPAYAAAAVALASIATALDGLDGWMARRTRLASSYGARFDLEVDALLIMVLAILAWRYEKAGVWILMSGLMRYLFLAAGAFWRWMQHPLPASRRRQTICVVQIVGLLLALLPAISPPVSTLVAAISLAALSYSFLVDTVWLWQNAS